jgi:hypothetical protein
MTIDELIERLKRLRDTEGGDTRVLVDGYEDGYDNIGKIEIREVADKFEDPDYERFSWSGQYEDDPSFVPKGATVRYRVVILHR